MSESPLGPPVQIAYAVADVTASAVRWAEATGAGPLGHLVELYEPSERLVGMYDMVATAARDWDGTNVLRHFG